jgi:hypothetical protein
VQNCVKTIQELLATGEPIGICAQRIAFARLYAAFFHDRRNQMLPEAAEHLVVMLRDGIAPKAWWGVLFTDGLELLQHGTQPVSLRGLPADSQTQASRWCSRRTRRRICCTSCRRSTLRLHRARARTTSRC